MRGHCPALNRLLIAATLACAALTPSIHADSIPAGAGGYEDLVELLDEFLAFRDPDGDEPRQIVRDKAGQAIDPIADHGADSIAWRRERMRQFQERIDDMNVAAWDRSRQVDYLAVRSRLNQEDFILRISRP